MPTTWKETQTWRKLTALDRPRSQGPVQPSSMELACEEQVSMAIHHSTASLASYLTDKDVCIPRYCPTSSHGQGAQRSSEEVCARACVCLCVCVHNEGRRVSYPFQSISSKTLLEDMNACGQSVT